MFYNITLADIMGQALIPNCNSDKMLYLINKTALFICIYYEFILYSQKSETQNIIIGSIIMLIEYHRQIN